MISEPSKRGYVVEYRMRGTRQRLIVWAATAGDALAIAQRERHWCSRESFHVVSRDAPPQPVEVRGRPAPSGRTQR